MGYETYYDGQIQLKDSKSIKIIKYLIKEEEPPFNENYYGMFRVDENGMIDISGGWRNYEEEMEKICLFIKSLDENAEGEIKCDGEDSFDFWKIDLNENGVEILRGEITYEFDMDYSDEKMEEKAKSIMNDKEITKKLILSELI